jgi:large subunit ribosomal protein LP0
MSRTISDRKKAYAERLMSYVNDYKSILLVNADNVGSYQLQKVRLALRASNSVVLMGKNTMIRTILKERAPAAHAIRTILPYVQGNIGFIFTNSDIREIRTMVEEIVEPAAAKAGTIAPSDVVVQPGGTGMDPGQTAFFQSLNIPTKIFKNQIEILNRVDLIKAGDKITASAASLLSRLDIRPFHYGLKVVTVFDNGSVFSAKVLDLTEDDLSLKFINGLRQLAAIGMRIGYPTAASVPHLIVGGFKKLVALSVATEIEMDETKDVKAYLADPTAFAAANKTEETKEAEKEAEPEPEEESESSEAGGFGGMFGDSDDDSD